MVGTRFLNRKRGFTFIEVLVAMLFMAIVIPVAVRALTVSNRAGVVAERKRVAMRLADTVLTESVITDSWRDGEVEGHDGVDRHDERRGHTAEEEVGHLVVEPVLRGAAPAEGQQQHQGDRDDGAEQVVEQVRGFFIRGLSVVPGDADMDVAGEDPAPDHLHPIKHRLRHEGGVGVLALGHGQGDRGGQAAGPGLSAGQSYVVFGRDGLSGTLSLSNLNGDNGFALNGVGTDT